jgi:hypothetical protein
MVNQGGMADSSKSCHRENNEDGSYTTRTQSSQRQILLVLVFGNFCELVLSIAHDEGHESLSSSRSIRGRRERPALKP